MLTILHIITGLNDGGAEAALFRLCISDTKNKHTVVSMMDEGKYGPLLREAGVDVYCLGMPRGRIKLRSLLDLYHILQNHRSVVVQTWMYHGDLIGGLAARIGGIRSICWGIRHSDLARGVSPFSTIFIAKVCAFLSGIVPRKIVCCSQKAIEIHRNMGYRSDKMVCIPNGYDLSKFRIDATGREKIREEIGIKEEIPLLGMVARFDPVKDHETLINALSILKEFGEDFCCVLVGAGMEETNQKIKDQIQEKKLEKEIRLFGQRNDIPDVMNALDLHILSSSSEAFPNVIAEAMACGTPCVATDVGDSALIIGESGWLVPPKSPEKLAEKIRSALAEFKDVEKWQKRSIIAQERIASNYEISAVVKKYRKCWESVL